jgi:3-dehydroquinate synthase
MPQIEVQIDRQETYPIQAGFKLWDKLLAFCEARYLSRKVFIVMDSKVHRLYGKQIKKECGSYFQSCFVIPFPEGEASKSRAQLKRLQDELLKNKAERSTPLLAVGGGVTGDLAGFAAASTLRGIPLIHLPTSLLAMVDSAIGGKTGINHPAGKNLIGAFYQPDAVFADLQFLQTLDRREWIGGLAEMLKYAAIRQPAMFDDLKEVIDEGFQPSEHWLELIQKSMEIKVDIVQQDEKEQGTRAFLNFGHTFGHALEKQLGFGNISHGEAVFIGMLAEICLSKRLGARVDAARFNPFKRLYEDVTLPDWSCATNLIETMRRDKKVKDETIRLALLCEWGEPYLFSCRDDSLLKEVWQYILDEFK